MIESAMDLLDDLTHIYKAAIAAVDPYNAVRSCMSATGKSLLFGRGDPAVRVDLESIDRIIVVGGGKAGAPMARAVEDILGNKVSGGLVCVKEGHGCPLEYISIAEASHPVPDRRGEEAAGRMMKYLHDAGERDLVISLISGGGSALLPLPPEGISLDDKRNVTELLLRSGASIHEINAVRKHISLLKGGQCARVAYPARVINLVMSDVVGDDLDVIASGPFVPDRSSYSSVGSIFDKYSLWEKIPPAVVNRISEGIRGSIEENPDPGDVVFEKVTNQIIGSNIIALKAAAGEAAARGYKTVILSSMIEGDNNDACAWHSRILMEANISGHPVPRPACILSGGETTVVVRGYGKGGRNQDFVMKAIPLIKGIPRTLVASVGTDGTDGPTDAAGAWVTGETMETITRSGVDLEGFIDNNDSYGLFTKIGGLIRTGPTMTNVMDIRIMLLG